MDIGIIGLYILTFCVVAVGATVLGVIFYNVIKSTYWLITDQIDWNIMNIAMVLWCLLVIIGISCIIIGLFQTL